MQCSTARGLRRSQTSGRVSSARAVQPRRLTRTLMSGDNVTAEIGALRAELDAFASTMLARLDAVEAQPDMLSRVVIAKLTILAAATTAGIFRMSRGALAETPDPAQWPHMARTRDAGSSAAIDLVDLTMECRAVAVDPYRGG